MKNKTNLQILNKTINDNYKLIINSNLKNTIKTTKYLPPYFKEWKNTLYYYNNYQTKNIPASSKNIDTLIQSYFNLFLKNYQFFSKKKRSRITSSSIKNSSLLRQIHVSKPEIKFTNSIAIITIYTINIRNLLFKRLMNYSYYYIEQKEWEKKIIQNQKKWIKTKPFSLRKFIVNKYLFFIGYNNSDSYEINLHNFKDILKFKFKLLSKGLQSYNLSRELFFSREIQFIYYKYLKLLYKFNLEYFSNSMKFNTNGTISFISKLKLILSNILNKKIELNLINLKSVGYNSDIFTKVLALKFKRKNINVIWNMLAVINKGKINIEDISRKLKMRIKNSTFNIFNTKYKDISLISIINKNNFNSLFKELYSTNKFSTLNLYKEISTKNYTKLYNMIFNSIKYKNTGGIRLVVKGRLTKRYRADRAVYKLFWKGGLKNIDSSYAGLPSTMFRGQLESNVVYSISTSRRRIGAFAVKGWISGN